jgi:serine/threonine protein kinase
VPQTRQGRLGIEPVLASRYEIICRLARGGMGTIYLGRHLGLDRRVAIKVLHPEKRGDEELVSLFHREAAAIKHLSHPNTVRLYDAGETDSGLLYLVMEHLEGECLDSVLERRGALPASFVVHAGVQVLKSLIEAHGRGIVHRDIKPSNLMLCRQLGETDLVKVLDFGIAWHRLRGAPASPDRPGEVVGTPRYMSPEQLAGEEVDPRSDLYSLGLTLYELATDRPYFTATRLGRVVAERARKKLVELPPELQRTRLGAVLARSLQASPADRFPAAGDMLEALLAAPIPVPLVALSDLGLGPRGRAGDTPFGGVEAFDPTVPRVPGRPLGAGPEPAPEPGDASALELLPPHHPLVDLLRARVEARLRRRTTVTALLSAALAVLATVLVMLAVA